MRLVRAAQVSGKDPDRALFEMARDDNADNADHAAGSAPVKPALDSDSACRPVSWDRLPGNAIPATPGMLLRSSPTTRPPKHVMYVHVGGPHGAVPVHAVVSALGLPSSVAKV